MPYRSKRQAAFFEACRNNPDKMKAKCPPKKVLDEYHRENYPAKPKKVKYH